MSRIGKKPIDIKNVKVSREGNVIKINGKFGELKAAIHPNIYVDIKNDEIIVTRPNDEKQNRALHGLTRALIQNMVTGVTEGFTKTLEIIGVGYKAELKGKNLLLTIGYSHPIYFVPPDSITIEVPAPTQVKISGADKDLVGLVSAKIRSFREPEPYKGKGIRYSDEVIIRKAGKTAGK